MTSTTTASPPHQDAEASREARTATATAGSRDQKEVTPMLSALIDSQTAALSTGTSIPCREYDAELWFAESPADVEQAKALCGACPARVSCLAGALDRQEPWGVWGGQLVVQGAIVARKRPRGRPRKSEVAAA
jgi:WhiB family redox-sensing transcriptional regulator